MDTEGFSVVTGAFGNTGRYITQELLARGERVRTLTGHPDRPNPFGGHITVAPFNFDDPPALVESLRGADTLYNTYWARFAVGEMTYEKAVRNSHMLISAAREAGVRRIVQITVTHASEDASIPYFRGKGQVERAVIESGLSYAILRPAMVFGPNDILLNNIAWLLRHVPVFAVPGSGEYKVTPVFVIDVAELAVRAGHESDNQVMDAVGPETFTFNELLRLIAEVVHSRTLMIHLPPGLALFMASMAGRFLHDIVLEKWEVDAMAAGLLYSDCPPTGQTRLSGWLREHESDVGIRYHSDLERHYIPHVVV